MLGKQKLDGQKLQLAALSVMPVILHAFLWIVLMLICTKCKKKVL